MHLPLLFFFLATSAAADEWRYTTERPSDDWTAASFDDAEWSSGESGFGTAGTPGARIGTQWNTPDIWLRRTVSLDVVPANPALQIHHDEDVQVFLNGQKIIAREGYTTDYKLVPISADVRGALRTGDNLLAVHCRQTRGGQYIDVRLVDGENPPPLPKGTPFKSDLITRWGKDVTPENAWTEYPRPLMERDGWQNLNGRWDYALTPASQTEPPEKWAGKILVPFPLESRLGGVQELMSPEEALWYRRAFTVAEDSGPNGGRTVLNFEAVDYRCEVFVNGTSVGSHTGGNVPFSVDVTDAVRDGENELIVRVEDDTEEWQLRGKQVINPSHIWYTRVSGIWQTVWLERVPAAYVRDIKISTDAEDGSITVRPDVTGEAVRSVRLRVLEGDTEIAEATAMRSGDATSKELPAGRSDASAMTVVLKDAKLWSPASPHLYDLEVSLLNDDGDVVDRVRSYAGIRTVGKSQDADGHWRFTLNGEPVFHWGPLDQGWWPDGLLTPPSDEAMAWEIEWLKSAGFNMIRKHIKVEPRRYYAHCDRIGMLVWQDQISGGKFAPWTFLRPDPADAEWPDEPHEQFMAEFEAMVSALESHPSIVVWTPFNEAWGQHRTMEVGRWTVERDPSRLVNIASGGNFWPVGDVADRHNYPEPAFPLEDGRFDDYVKVVGEFGGHGFPVEGHLWDTSANNWGYGDLPKTMDEYRHRYERSIGTLNDLRRRGVAAGVYTQTTDVEGEINGLMTYDREVIKISAEDLKAIHAPLLESP